MEDFDPPVERRAGLALSDGGNPAAIGRVIGAAARVPPDVGCGGGGQGRSVNAQQEKTKERVLNSTICNKLFHVDLNDAMIEKRTQFIEKVIQKKLKKKMAK